MKSSGIFNLINLSKTKSEVTPSTDKQDAGRDFLSLLLKGLNKKADDIENDDLQEPATGTPMTPFD